MDRVFPIRDLSLNTMKNPIAATIILLISMVSGVVLALLLSPFWNWFEAMSGIESIGHSGPANWCYFSTIIFSLIAMTLLYRLSKSDR